jgi:hypothetical protein
MAFHRGREPVSWLFGLWPALAVVRIGERAADCEVRWRGVKVGEEQVEFVLDDWLGQIFLEPVLEGSVDPGLGAEPVEVAQWCFIEGLAGEVSERDHGFGERELAALTAGGHWQLGPGRLARSGAERWLVPVTRGAIADNGVVESDIVERAVVVVFEAGDFEAFNREWISGSRPTAHGPRLTDHDSRSTDHDPCFVCVCVPPASG